MPCSPLGMQSALNPAGREAEQLAELFMWMGIGAVVIWLAMIALALYAPRATALSGRRGANLLIVGGGVVFPLVVLTSLLFLGLPRLRDLLTPAAQDALALQISGQQWWWRVRYHVPGQDPIELANEIRLPVGVRVNTTLMSADVIHSFWVPSITGKMDMIPGRINRLSLEPTRVGTFRGACAEFCGSSHALMNFIVVVMEQGEFDAWLRAQAQPAIAAADTLAQQGERAFLARGCNTCHAVRGTVARGVVGPDLTHVGSRHTIAAGLLPARPEQFSRWIANTERLKPDAHMPAFAGLPDDELAALAAYLTQLK
jgi:cytochrome c oxidase subunit 2